jgi:hypothetical protein
LKRPASHHPRNGKAKFPTEASFYVRYLNGVLSVGFGTAPQAAIDDHRFEWELGDGLDGVEPGERLF